MKMTNHYRNRSSVSCYFVRTESEWDRDHPYILSNKTIDQARNLFMHIHTAPDIANYMSRFTILLIVYSLFITEYLSWTLYVFLFFWLQLNILVFPPLIEYILIVVHTPQNLWDLWCILQCFCISYFTSLPWCHHNTFHIVNATPKDGCSLFFSFPPHLPHSLSVAPLVYLLIDDPALSSRQHSSKLVFPISLVLPPGQALNLLLLVTMPPQYLIPILRLIESPCSIIWRTQHPYHIGVYSLSCFDYMLLWCPMMYDVAPTEHQRS